MLRRHAFQIERRHRHGRRQEGRLEIDRHHSAEEYRIDLKVAQQGDEDRAEDHDDLGPLEGPAEQKDNQLRDELKPQRRQVHAQHPALNQRLAAVQREHGGEERRTDEQPANHRRRLRCEKRRFLDVLPKLR